MCLSTVSKEGRHSGRIVLLKGLEEGKLIFYTNYTSRKGENLSFNPAAALTFFWPELERQVRIEGTIAKVSEEMSLDYFLSRPVTSQVGAIVSPQSKNLKDREELENRYREILSKVDTNPPQKPPHWAGYFVIHHYYEFWQGRPSRLHDRLAYSKDSQNYWARNRLAP